MSAHRMQYLTVATLVFLGAFLTGISRVHWFLYVPVGMLLFAAATGICPGLRFWKWLGFRD